MSLFSIKTYEKNNNCYYLVKCFGIKLKLRNKLQERINSTIHNVLDDFIKCVKFEISDIETVKPIVKTKETLVESLVNNNISICRYGDGEFSLAKGEGISFQSPNNILSYRLKSILKSNKKNCYICIPNVFGNLDCYKKYSRLHWRKYLCINRNFIYKNLDLKKTYYDSFISRPYFIFNDTEHVKDYFSSMKKIWHQKNVIFVEGMGSRLGVGNDLFDNTKSIKRILCPNVNAFDKYEKILEACLGMSCQSKNDLFILALGPTATVLAYDLSEKGYRALDMGHIDIEYEWFLAGATEKIDIKNKNVNEIKGATNRNFLLNDKNYMEQILCRID